MHDQPRRAGSFGGEPKRNDFTGGWREAIQVDAFARMVRVSADVDERTLPARARSETRVSEREPPKQNNEERLCEAFHLGSWRSIPPARIRGLRMARESLRRASSRPLVM